MTLFDPDNPELDAAIARHPSNVIAAVFPWRGGWAAQVCIRCGHRLDIADGITEHAADGKEIGWRHTTCPSEGNEDAV